MACLAFLLAISCAPKVTATKQDRFLRVGSNGPQVAPVNPNYKAPKREKFTMSDYSSKRNKHMRENQAKLRKIPTQNNVANIKKRTERNARRDGAAVTPMVLVIPDTPPK